MRAKKRWSSIADMSVARSLTILIVLALTLALTGSAAENSTVLTEGAMDAIEQDDAGFVADIMFERSKGQDAFFVQEQILMTLTSSLNGIEVLSPTYEVWMTYPSGFEEPQELMLAQDKLVVSFVPPAQGQYTVTLRATLGDFASEVSKSFVVVDSAGLRSQIMSQERICQTQACDNQYYEIRGEIQSPAPIKVTPTMTTIQFDTQRYVVAQQDCALSPNGTTIAYACDIFTQSKVFLLLIQVPGSSNLIEVIADENLKEEEFMDISAPEQARVGEPVTVSLKTRRAYTGIFVDVDGASVVSRNTADAAVDVTLSSDIPMSKRYLFLAYDEPSQTYTKAQKTIAFTERSDNDVHVISASKVRALYAVEQHGLWIMAPLDDVTQDVRLDERLMSIVDPDQVFVFADAAPSGDASKLMRKEYDESSGRFISLDEASKGAGKVLARLISTQFVHEGGEVVDARALAGTRTDATMLQMGGYEIYDMQIEQYRLGVDYLVALPQTQAAHMRVSGAYGDKQVLQHGGGRHIIAYADDAVVDGARYTIIAGPLFGDMRLYLNDRPQGYLQEGENKFSLINTAGDCSYELYSDAGNLIRTGSGCQFFIDMSGIVRFETYYLAVSSGEARSMFTLAYPKEQDPFFVVPQGYTQQAQR